VREKLTCRSCEKISQPPAPFHAIPRGWAGPSLIAMLVFEKYGQHQPLNRQAERFAREGVELSLSTLADLVGHAAVALQPIHALIENHVLAAHRQHGDDTTVPLLARGGTKKARLWTYVRDDRPWNGGARRRRSSTSPAIAPRPIPTSTSPDGRGSCKPMPMVDTTTFTAMTVKPEL